MFSLLGGSQTFSLTHLSGVLVFTERNWLFKICFFADWTGIQLTLVGLNAADIFFNAMLCIYFVHIFIYIHLFLFTCIS